MMALRPEEKASWRAMMALRPEEKASWRAMMALRPEEKASRPAVVALASYAAFGVHGLDFVAVLRDRMPKATMITCPGMPPPLRPTIAACAFRVP